jgi:phage shock protein A
MPADDDAPDPVSPEAAVVPVEADAAPADTGYTAGGAPTFEMVREKIETRFGTSIGSQELAAQTPEGRRVEEQFEARQKAAAEKLEEIRRSMKADGNG